MSKRTIAAILLSGACAAPYAHAEFWDGNYLLAKINGDAGDHLLALGYIAGAADMAMGWYACPPSNVTVGQIRDMTKVLLDRTPESRHQSADTFVAGAMRAVWPCKRQEKSQERNL